jgi:amino acid adenylation domain-containing protein
MKINILHYLINTTIKAPHKIAVIDGESKITFEELNRKSKLLAQILITQKDIKNKPIAVFLPKSIESVVADIAITYSANIYMNLDIKSPNTRISNILELIEPEIIITNRNLANTLKSFNNSIKLVLIDELDFDQNINDDFIDNRLEYLIDTDPMCIINTSGSTGTPKGVVLNHKSFIDFTEWAIATLKISEDEIVGSLSPLVFDIYSFELCMLMSQGSTLVLLQDSLAIFPAKLLEVLLTNKVSFIFWVPTIMVNIANMDLLSKIELPNLKTVWFAGEVFPTKQFKYWKAKLSNTMFVNLYGPIEITLDCTYFIVNRDLKDDEPIPIGFPCRNTDVLILNENNQPATINEDGELCVRGTSLAMGYYNNPEKTAAAFTQNPLNTCYPEIIYRTGDIVFKNESNEIIFKGRKDNLIKHMGYRIELGEIEHVIINTLKLVENGCVVYNFEKKEITLFYENNEETPIAQMKQKIAEVFPKYMIPTVFHKLDELPRNTNGKIDKLLLNTKINQ